MIGWLSSVPTEAFAAADQLGPWRTLIQIIAPAPRSRKISTVPTNTKLTWVVFLAGWMIGRGSFLSKPMIVFLDEILPPPARPKYGALPRLRTNRSAGRFARLSSFVAAANSWRRTLPCGGRGSARDGRSSLRLRRRRRHRHTIARACDPSVAAVDPRLQRIKEAAPRAGKAPELTCPRFVLGLGRTRFCNQSRPVDGRPGSWRKIHPGRTAPGRD